MIKHLTLLTALTLSLSAFDNVYLTAVKEGIKSYHVEETQYNVPAHEIPMVTKSNKREVTTSSRVTKEEKITVINKSLNSSNDIKIFKTKEIQPINYTNTVSLNNLQVSEKKQKFFHMILPAILISKANLKLKRERVISLMSTPKDELFKEDREFLEGLHKTYKTTDNRKLISRLKTHPVSIILAQAAIESAWGDSRFFKEGNNIFGMWSYNKDEPRIKTHNSRNGKAIYVKKYATISDAIDDYFIVIGRGAYKSFRKHRDITNDPLKLVKYLVHYCELKNYPRKLKKFIIHNKLRKFDKFKIASIYSI